MIFLLGYEGWPTPIFITNIKTGINGHSKNQNHALNTSYDKIENHQNMPSRLLDKMLNSHRNPIRVFLPNPRSLSTSLL